MTDLSDNARFEHLEASIEKLNEIVTTGNGHPSLLERMALLEQAVQTLKQTEDEKKHLLWVILGGIATSLLGQFGPKIWFFVTSH